MKNLLTNDGVQIAIDKHQPCVSHKTIADALGVDKRSVFRLLTDYQNDFEKFGVLRFEIAKPIKGKDGRPERIAYLNEDQCFLLLTYSKNTVKARQAKSQLVKAFSCARDAITQRQTQYLPMYHHAHDSIKSVVTMAHTNGSTTPEHIFHMSYEKLINKVFGIDAGARGRLSVAQQCAVTVAYATIENILNDAAQRGLDHKQAYQMVKDSLPKVVALLGISPRLAA